MSHVSIVVALGKNRELGKDGKLLWHIPDDLKRFKRLTVGHPIIMGRKTFDSIVAIIGKPLPERTNIVISRDPKWAYPGTVVAHDLESAFVAAREAPGSEEIHVGGGAQLYEQALPYVDRLYLTLINDTKPADTFFPEYEHLFTKKVSEEARDYNGLEYTWVNLEKN